VRLDRDSVEGLLGIFSVALFIFLSVAAPTQTEIQPQIMIEAGPVIRSQTAIVDVRVVIPKNRLIPAETKASLTWDLSAMGKRCDHGATETDKVEGPRLVAAMRSLEMNHPRRLG